MNKTPIILIGVVLVVAVICGGLFYSWSKTAQTTASNTKSPTNAAPAKPSQTIPPDAPRGADPPEQMGSPNASVTLEEFADLQCGSCAHAHPIMNEIKSMYGSRIHFIFRNFPLQIPAHDKSYEAAVAAEAAGMQGKFWDMQNMLFSNQQTWTAAPTYKQIWKGYAEKMGLNIPKWDADMAGIEAKGRVNSDMERGKAIGINSTPTLFINGVSVSFDQMNVDSLKGLIDAELQKGSPQNSTGPSSAPPANSRNSNK